MTTTTMMTTRSNSLMGTMTRRMTEGGDMVAAAEGEGNGLTAVTTTQLHSNISYS
jgi:hypothetical protein